MARQWTPSQELKVKLREQLKVSEDDIEHLCFQLEFFINEAGMPEGHDGSASRQIEEIAKKAQALANCLAMFERDNQIKFMWLDGFNLTKISHDDLNQDLLEDFRALNAYPTAHASLMLKALLERSNEYLSEMKYYKKLEPLTEALRDAFGCICYHNAEGDPLNDLKFSAAERSRFIQYCDAVLQDYFEFNQESRPAKGTIQTAIRNSRWFEQYKQLKQSRVGG